MGAEVFPDFPDLVAEADRILGYSIVELCLADPGGKLRDTRYAQPAIFFVNALLARRALAAGAAYDYFAGHSLGEYNALVAAGCLGLVDGLALVERRAALMAQIRGGGMSAVVGLSADQVQALLVSSGLRRLFIAGRNTDRSTTIAGDQGELAHAARILTRAGARQVAPVNASGPFHTPLMRPATRAFTKVLRECEFRPGHTPVMSCVTGGPFDPAWAVDLLGRQLSEPVEWVRAVRSLRAAGVTEFAEVSGKTLTAMLRGIAQPAGDSGTAQPPGVSRSGGISQPASIAQASEMAQACDMAQPAGIAQPGANSQPGGAARPTGSAQPAGSGRAVTSTVDRGC